MLHAAPSEHPHQTDYVFVCVAAACVVILVVPAAVAAFSLQRLLQPADSLLFGPTGIGEMMFAVPAILLGLVPATAAALILTKWIRRGLRMPDIPPVQLGAWAKSIDWQSINWRLVGGIAGVILIALAAKGFGSYFCVTEDGVSVRPPLEFSMRHYEWKDVTTVSVHCRESPTRRKSRFRYALEMSDGYDVDLSSALLGPTGKLREASAARFAATISRPNMPPSVRYEFDVSEDALASLGRRHGVVLSNALREQVTAHGGTLE